tara:strand:- start:1185 stop:1409 length:225 start_codon:yes stop_codon:yes gene_type:complete
MTEIQELHIAMLNTYDVLAENLTVEDVMVTTNSFMLFNPTEGIKSDTCDTLLEHFEDLEEYEKCQKILDYQKTL